MKKNVVLNKAQASIEYLTTYGWIFLIIIVAVGAISYFGLLSPNRYMPSGCNTGDQIECNDAVIDYTGVFILSLQNNMGQDIRITDVVGQNINIINCNSPSLPTGGYANLTCDTSETPPENEVITVDFILIFSRDRAGANKTYNVSGSFTGKVVPPLPPPPALPPPTCAQLGGDLCNPDTEYCPPVNIVPTPPWPGTCCNISCVPFTQCMDGIDNDADSLDEGPNPFHCVDMLDYDCSGPLDPTEDNTDPMNCRTPCEEAGYDCEPSSTVCTLPLDGHGEPYYGCPDGYICCDW